MAGRKLSLSKPTIALAANTAKTVLQSKANSTPHKLLRLTLGFDGASPTDGGVLVELVRQTSAGTMSALTARLRDNGITYTPLLTAQHTATVEPTDSGEVIWSTYVQPQEGGSWPLSEIDDDLVKEATWLGVRCTAKAIVNVTPTLDVEE